MTPLSKNWLSLVITDVVKTLTKSAAVVYGRYRSDELHTGLSVLPVQTVPLRDGDRVAVGVLQLRRQPAARDRPAVQGGWKRHTT